MNIWRESMENKNKIDFLANLKKCKQEASSWPDWKKSAMPPTPPHNTYQDNSQKQAYKDQNVIKM